MATREDIIAQWHDGLQQAEVADPTESPHSHWARRIYARVYRFLLACYEDAPWKTSPDGLSTVQRESTSATALPLARDGKPVRPVGEISKVLQAVHAANNGVAAGSMSGEDFQRSWLRAGEFKYSALASQYRLLLKERGIHARIVRRTFRYFVEVQRTDFEIAMDLFQAHREELSHAGYCESAKRWFDHPWVKAAFLGFYFLILIPAAVGVIVFTVIDPQPVIGWIVAAVIYVAILLGLNFGTRQVRRPPR